MRTPHDSTFVEIIFIIYADSFFTLSCACTIAPLLFESACFIFSFGVGASSSMTTFCHDFCLNLMTRDYDW